MEVYSYSGQKLSGKKVKGYLVANNESEVKNILLAKKIRILKSQIDEKPKFHRFEFKSERLKKALLYFKHLKPSLRAKIDLLQIHDDFLSSLPSDEKHFRHAIFRVRKAISLGKDYETALSYAPEYFSEIQQIVIGLGEKSSNLAEFNSAIIDWIEWELKIISQFKTTMTYPIFLISGSIGLFGLLITTIFPTFRDMSSSLGKEMDPMVLVFLDLGDWLGNYWWSIPVGLFFVFLALKIYRRNEKGLLKTDEWMLHFPLFGATYKKLQFARFSRIWRLLTLSGMTLSDTLSFGSKAIHNRAIQEALRNVEKDLKRGLSLDKAFEEREIFPSRFLHVISSAVSTGEFDDALNFIVDEYDEEVSLSLDRVLGTIKPLVLFIVAMIVVLSATALILSTFSVGDAIPGT